MDVFYEEIADSEIDKLIMSFNAAKHSEIQPIYHIDPEEELLITFEDDSKEEIQCNSEDINCKRKRKVRSTIKRT